MATKGVQIKVLLPTALYERLQRESAETATTMAGLVRIAVSERDRRQRLMQIAQAKAAGIITEAEAADQMALLDDRRMNMTDNTDREDSDETS